MHDHSRNLSPKTWRKKRSQQEYGITQNILILFSLRSGERLRGERKAIKESCYIYHASDAWSLMQPLPKNVTEEEDTVHTEQRQYYIGLEAQMHTLDARMVFPEEQVLLSALLVPPSERDKNYLFKDQLSALRGISASIKGPRPSLKGANISLRCTILTLRSFCFFEVWFPP